MAERVLSRIDGKWFMNGPQPELSTSMGKVALPIQNVIETDLQSADLVWTHGQNLLAAPALIFLQHVDGLKAAVAAEEMYGTSGGASRNIKDPKHHRGVPV
ncbi:MAG TPA: hypothetical protein VN648_30700, partial [Candidatus Methylomirabilis sp.]|nr:hypothetical protein [Candidatus Methylomirabilis sp.]